MKMYKNIEKEAIELLNNKNLFNDKYKMKCLKWYQRIKIFFNSWIMALKVLPLVWQYIKKERNGN